ncbi:hypothetical protein KEM44_00715 (plasmid) [Sinorhizobium meliloti]|nr:hypothetical protein KEM44_00715 [Sinorhizobium meliloti]
MERDGRSGVEAVSSACDSAGVDELDKWRVCRRCVMISAPPHFHAGGSCPLNTKGRPEPPFHHQGFGSYERFLELRLSI